LGGEGAGIFTDTSKASGTCKKGKEGAIKTKKKNPRLFYRRNHKTEETRRGSCGDSPGRMGRNGKKLHVYHQEEGVSVLERGKRRKELSEYLRGF